MLKQAILIDLPSKNNSLIVETLKEKPKSIENILKESFRYLDNSFIPLVLH